MKINRLNLCSTLLFLLTSGVGAYLSEEPQLGFGCDKSYFDIDVGIHPADVASLAACDSKGSKKMSNMIKRIIDKKFQQYVSEVLELQEETLSEFCDAEESTRRDRRSLMLILASGGFGYAGSSECIFCDPDTADDEDWNPPSEYAFGQAPTSAPSPSPGMAPSPSPSMGPSLGNRVRANDAELKLRTTLQRRIRRALTHKVNHNERRSCLVGSNSTVEVHLTPLGSGSPPMVCE